MGYKLVISDRAESHIDSIIDYVVNTLKNPGAASAILADIEEAYDKLEYMAETLALCNDYYLAETGYRKIVLARHNFVILYCVEGNKVHISGVFHMRENYVNKI